MYAHIHTFTHSLTPTQMSGEPPSIKRRRISAHAAGSSSNASKDSATPTSGGVSDSSGISGSGLEKKRRWGKQRSASSSAANITSDVLKVRRAGEGERERRNVYRSSSRHPRTKSKPSAQ